MISGCFYIIAFFQETLYELAVSLFIPDILASSPFYLQKHLMNYIFIKNPLVAQQI